MRHFEIEPNVGVGPIKLGMPKSEVKKVLGEPEFEGDGRAAYFSGFMIDFDDSNHVEFVEVARSALIKVSYKGVILHDILASEAVEYLSNFDSYDINDPELGYSYVFKALQISLWRGGAPENEFDEEGRYFESVGVATKNYFL